MSSTDYLNDILYIQAQEVEEEARRTEANNNVKNNEECCSPIRITTTIR